MSIRDGFLARFVSGDVNDGVRCRVGLVQKFVNRIALYDHTSIREIYIPYTGYRLRNCVLVANAGVGTSST